MDKKIILAVAGSGKTYHLCHSIETTKRNLVLAFTNENIHNLRNEIVNKNDNIPQKTVVTTFHSFIYSIFIRPYESYVAEDYSQKHLRSKGVSLAEVQQQYKNGRPNPKYVSQDKIEHYYNKSLEYIYCSRMSELIVKHKSVLNKGIMRLNKFYDSIYIDEFQDFREFDYKLIEQIIKHFNGEMLLVGDYYQHSVSGENNSGAPFSKKKRTISYNEYIILLKELGLTVDTETLVKSRRCSKTVCDYICEKLKIRIKSIEDRTTDIIVVDSEEKAKEIIKNQEIMKLVYDNSKKYGKQFMNWGYSKGNTYNDVCVILTKSLEKFTDDNFDISKEKQPTINKLYVALSRAKGNLFILNDDLFKKAY